MELLIVTGVLDVQKSGVIVYRQALSPPPRGGHSAQWRVTIIERLSENISWHNRQFIRELAHVTLAGEHAILKQEELSRKKYPSDLTDEQWAIIGPLVPPAKQNPRGGRPRKVAMREVRNTIFYQNRTGCQWDMLPHD